MPDNIAQTEVPNSQTTTKLTPQNSAATKKPVKKSGSVFVINEIKPIKTTPPKMLEMQQAFNENYYNMPPASAYNSDNNSGDKKPANSSSTPNPNATNSTNATSGANGLGTLGQIAPLFNVLSGGKNPQIGSLISALSSGNMDMNKVISAMAPTGSSGGGAGMPNLFGMLNNSNNKSVNAKPKETPTQPASGKSIKDLHKI